MRRSLVACFTLWRVGRMGSTCAGSDRPVFGRQYRGEGDPYDRAVAAVQFVSVAAAYLLWGFCSRALNLSTVVTVTLVEPAVAATLSVLILDETFTAVLAARVSMVAIGVWPGTRVDRQVEPKQTSSRSSDLTTTRSR